MIGTHRAFDMFVTGRPVDAKEAFQIGLIKEITAKEDLLPKTMAFAKTDKGSRPGIQKHEETDV